MTRPSSVKRLNVFQGTCAFAAESPVKEEPRVVNIDELPVYKQFQFSCSMNTARVYLYNEVMTLGPFPLRVVEW